MAERYYLKVDGMGGSKVPHDTLAEAYIEADRLFKINESKLRVEVLQVIGTIGPELTKEKALGDNHGAVSYG